MEYLPAITTKHQHETNRYFEPSEDTENCFTENTDEDNKEQNDQSDFNSYESTTNLTQWSYSQSEIYDAQKEIPTPDYNFTDDVCLSETKSTNASDKCCCIKLLEISLCNVNCIWHGIPP